MGPGLIRTGDDDPVDQGYRPFLVGPAREVLAPGAHCHYIVGNSKFYDTLLPVERIYAAMFEDAEFVNVCVETIRKRTSKKELYEFVVHADMPKNSHKLPKRGSALSIGVETSPKRGFVGVAPDVSAFPDRAATPRCA